MDDFLALVEGEEEEEEQEGQEVVVKRWMIQGFEVFDWLAKLFLEANEDLGMTDSF